MQEHEMNSRSRKKDLTFLIWKETEREREREKEGGRQIEKIYYESLEKIPSELVK